MQQANLLKPESPLEILLLDTKIIPAVAEVISEAAPVERLPETESEMSHSNIDIMEAHLNKRFDFRYNKVIGQIEYKFKEESKYKILSDYIANSILRELQKNKIGAYSTSLRSLLNSNFSEVYDPFVEYFNSLPEWDGQTDHIAALAATVKTNDDELWQACFKKWLVAMVACALDDETINHTVIVFSGKQGVGKTTWMLNLIPDQLKTYKFSGTINPNNKDTIIQLSECMLINLDELENLNKSEIGSLKELITKNGIRIRRPYGINNENLPRRASFAGSVNCKQFLNDTTGSRRFLCFESLEINFNHGIDLSKVYAQAYHLFKSKEFKFWFDQEEIEKISANNEQYSVISVEEELLLSNYEPAEVEGCNLFLSATEIATALAEKANSSISNSMVNKLGKALREYKFPRLKRGSRYVYAMKTKDAEIVGYQSRFRLESDLPV